MLDSVRGLDKIALHILTTTHHSGLKVAASKCLLCFSAVFAVTPKLLSDNMMREAKNIRLIESMLKDGDLVLKSYLFKILSVLAMTV